jgi:hypothetical protein
MYENVASPSLTCPKQGNNQKIIILYWTTFYHFVDFANAGLGGKPFGHCDSLSVNGSGCKVTSDRNLLNESDAVMFHFRCLSGLLQRQADVARTAKSSFATSGH